MKYVDDSQLYLSFNAQDQEKVIGMIKDCIRDIRLDDFKLLSFEWQN